MKSVTSINPFNSVIQIIYDMVKAHGREFKVTSEQAIGTNFTIILVTTG